MSLGNSPKKIPWDDVQVIPVCLTVGGHRTGVQDFFRLELISAGYKRREPRWYSAQVLAYTGITGGMYQPQNKIFLAPTKRSFSYIVVTEQRDFFVRVHSKDNTLTEPCGLSFRELHRLDDDDLMDHLRLSHDEALTVLFDRYHRLVLSIALKIIRDAGEAEDLVQDVFLNLHQTAVRFDRARGSTKAWVIQMAYRRSYNRRQYLATRAFYSAEEVEQLVEKAMLPFGLQSPESRHLAAQMLDQVHGPQRKALHLVCLHGLTMEEVAARMGESVGNVRHHYYRGLAHLRGVIQERSRKAVVSPAPQEALNAKP